MEALSPRPKNPRLQLGHPLNCISAASFSTVEDREPSGERGDQGGQDTLEPGGAASNPHPTALVSRANVGRQPSVSEDSGNEYVADFLIGPADVIDLVYCDGHLGLPRRLLRRRGGPSARQSICVLYRHLNCYKMEKGSSKTLLSAKARSTSSMPLEAVKATSRFNLPRFARPWGHARTVRIGSQPFRLSATGTCSRLTTERRRRQSHRAGQSPSVVRRSTSLWSTALSTRTTLHWLSSPPDGVGAAKEYRQGFVP